MALVENIQREDLNAIEIALGMQRLIDECNLTQEALSEKVGKKRSTVSNYMRLLKLPNEVQLALKEGLISMGHAKAIAGAPEELQLRLLKKCIRKGLSVRQIEELVRALTDPAAKPAAPAEDEEYPESYARLVEQLEKFFSQEISIKRSKNGGGRIVIDFSDDRDIDRFIEKFEKRGASAEIRNNKYMKHTRGYIRLLVLFAFLALCGAGEASAQVPLDRYRSAKTFVRSGLMPKPDSLAKNHLTDSLLLMRVDSLLQDSTLRDSLLRSGIDSLRLRDSLAARLHPQFVPDSALLLKTDSLPAALGAPDSLAGRKDLRPRRDTISLSGVSWISLVAPGFGQIYNKQYWKLPILYGTVGAGLTLFFHENNTYKPLKRQDRKSVV